MPVIEVLTPINARPECCFRRALSVDLHTVPTRQTNENIVGGVRSGEFQLGDSVTFRVGLFGV